MHVNEHCHCHACGCEEHEHLPFYRRWDVLAVGGVLVAASMLPLRPLQYLALIAYLMFGLPIVIEMLHDMRHGEFFGECTLMSVASIGALVLGEFAEGAAVVLLYNLGERLSDVAVDRARCRIKNAVAMRDLIVNVSRDGQLIRIPCEQVAVGETVCAGVGERIALDGVVTDGNATADTAAITGESVPMDLTVGDRVLSGYLLLSGQISFTVDADADSCVVAQMEQAMEEAQKDRSKSETMLARFVGFYTPAVFLVALLIALVGSIVTGEISTWVRYALMLLAISCPCALVISVPLAYYAGCGAASARGILIKGGGVIDKMASVSAIAFDKTGTLTTGDLKATVSPAKDVDADKMRKVAYALLVHSTHPLASAFCAQFSKTGDQLLAGSVTETIGGGVQGVIEGKPAICGNATFLAQAGIMVEQVETTAIYVAWDGLALGAILFADSVKPTAGEAIEALHDCGIQKTLLLSGDRKTPVERVAKAVGIDAYQAELLPAQKQAQFAAFYDQNKNEGAVAYCGDGLNDSAVIAAADVGIAMGKHGAALSVSAADVVLMDEDLRRIAEGISISRRTRSIVKQNIFLALGLKVGILALCYTLLPTMGLAVFADVGVTLLTVANACRKKAK